MRTTHLRMPLFLTLLFFSAISQAASCPDQAVQRYKNLADRASGQASDDTQAYLQAAQYEMGVCACLSGQLLPEADTEGLRKTANIAKNNARQMKSGLTFRPWPGQCKFRTADSAGSAGTQGEGSIDMQQVMQLGQEFERRMNMTDEEAAAQFRDDLMQAGMSAHEYREGSHALSMSERARTRAAGLVADLEQLQIEADTTNPRAMIQQFNSQLTRLKNMEASFINEVNQSMGQQLEKFGNDINRNNVEGAVYGGLSMFGQMFENYEAKEALQKKKEQLLRQRDSQMRRAAEAMVTLNEKNRLDWLKRAAFASEATDEQYFLAWSNHFQCFTNHINANFSSTNSYWAENPCSIPAQQTVLPNNLMSKHRKFAQIAQRKFDTALSLSSTMQDVPPEAIVSFVDASIKFISAAINEKPDEYAYYYQMGKFAEWDPVTRYLGYSVVMENAPELFSSSKEYEIAMEKVRGIFAEALTTGDIDTIRQFLDVGAQENLRIDGEPALVFAIRADQADSVQVLLNHFAQSASEDDIEKRLTSALVVASSLDKPTVVSRLIDLGGDVDATFDGYSAVTAAARADADSVLPIVVGNSRQSLRYKSMYSTGPEARFAFVEPELLSMLDAGNDNAIRDLFFNANAGIQEKIARTLVENGRLDLLAGSPAMIETARRSEEVQAYLREIMESAFQSNAPGTASYQASKIIQYDLYRLPASLMLPREDEDEQQSPGVVPMDERIERLAAWLRNAVDLTKNVAQDSDKALRFANWAEQFIGRTDQLDPGQRAIINQQYVNNVLEEDEIQEARLARFATSPINLETKYDAVVQSMRVLHDGTLNYAGTSPYLEYVSQLEASKAAMLKEPVGYEAINVINARYCEAADLLELPVDTNCLNVTYQERAWQTLRRESTNLAQVAVAIGDVELFNALADRYDLTQIKGLKELVLSGDALTKSVAPDFLLPSFTYTPSDISSLVDGRHWGAIKKLIARGVIPTDYRDDEGNNLLHLALNEYEENTSSEDMRFCKLQTPGASAFTFFSPSAQVLSIHYEERYRDLARSLIALGVSPDEKNSEGRTVARRLKKIDNWDLIAECISTANDIPKRAARNEIRDTWEQVLSTTVTSQAVGDIDPWGPLGECSFLDRLDNFDENHAHQFGISAVHCMRVSAEERQQMLVAEMKKRNQASTMAVERPVQQQQSVSTQVTAGYNQPAPAPDTFQPEDPAMRACIEAAEASSGAAIGGPTYPRTMCELFQKQGQLQTLYEQDAFSKVFF